MELGPRNIRVNVLSPGLVETEGSRAIGAIGSEFQKIIEGDTPLGRSGRMKEITHVAAFLASGDSTWVNGQVLFVDGGYAV
jgi:3-oxoacyl-[acyl-carrier protein] reductase